MASDNANNQADTASGLLSGHAKYVKGATEATIGSVTGSQAWASSGEHDKADARAELRAAAENRDPAQKGYGKVEEVAGRVTGCEGMRREGEASSQDQQH
ncbi:hypothetical protein VTK73DRAFT_971 [Phialemonium thermophilum]|uniref:CsbD-like domain-containing protein n=1 Tax=Phialemonium thermophilum TaxID=223376 RepID=A0ABR3VU43_9PEZI